MRDDRSALTETNEKGGESYHFARVCNKDIARRFSILGHKSSCRIEQREKDGVRAENEALVLRRWVEKDARQSSERRTSVNATRQAPTSPLSGPLPLEIPPVCISEQGKGRALE